MLERQVRKAVEEVCKHNKARQVWMKVEQIVSASVAAKVGRLVEQGANEDVLDEFTKVWQRECLLAQKIKVHLGQLQNYVHKDNSDRLRMKQESIGLERSGVKTQAAEDQQSTAATGNRVLAALQARAARVGVPAKSSSDVTRTESINQIVVFSFYDVLT